MDRTQEDCRLMRHDVFSEEWLAEAKKKKGKGGLIETAGSAYSSQGTRRHETTCGATPSPLISKNAKYAPYKNKLEHSFALMLVGRKHAGQIRDWAYESHTLKLAQGKYHRPDFLIWHLDGTIEIAQTKGYHKNMRASLTGLAWAAQKNPWYRFTVWRYKNGWSYKEVRP